MVYNTGGSECPIVNFEIEPCACSLMDRALASEARGCGFDSRQAHNNSIYKADCISDARRKNIVVVNSDCYYLNEV